MANENVLHAVPTHKCGTDLMRKAVPIMKDGQEHDWNTYYCMMCRTYVYGPSGKERFETDNPKEMGDYITGQIKLEKHIW